MVLVSTALARALEPDEAAPRPLPAAITDLLISLAAPPRLAAHLRIVHDVAWQLADQLAAAHPALSFDRDAVLYGAASHDIGKVVHVNELAEPGSQHEPAGYLLLTEHGVPPRLARYARTHATWTAPDTTIEDHLVSLADKIWKARRVTDLEDLVTDALATASGVDRWQAFSDLDDILTDLASGADIRLAHQSRHPITAR